MDNYVNPGEYHDPALTNKAQEAVLRAIEGKKTPKQKQEDFNSLTIEQMESRLGVVTGEGGEPYDPHAKPEHPKNHLFWTRSDSNNGRTLIDIADPKEADELLKQGIIEPQF